MNTTLKHSLIFPSIRIADLARAREFYENTLGLEVIWDQPGELLLRAGKNSRLYLYEGPLSVAEHTVAYFYVADIRSAVGELAQKGITFEQYPDLKTDEMGIARDNQGIQYAWFKDPEGHILALAQIK